MRAGHHVPPNPFRRRIGAGKRPRVIAGAILVFFLLICFLTYLKGICTPSSDLAGRVDGAGSQRHLSPTTAAGSSPPSTNGSVFTSTAPVSPYQKITGTPDRTPVPSTATTSLPAQAAGPGATAYRNIFNLTDMRSARPFPVFDDITKQYEEGEYTAEEPERLPGLEVRRRTFTAAELLERFGDTDIVYSFVNGSEANHEYRKLVRRACMDGVLRAESNAYMSGAPPFGTTAFPTSTTRASVTPPPSPGDPDPYPRRNTEDLTSPPTTTAPAPFVHLSCMPLQLQRLLRSGGTLGDILQDVRGAASTGADSRDRETDELRHSLRSLEQHVRWHRGRVVMVSPGHHPTWIDGAKNFLAGLCGDARVQALRSSGTHLRVTTVHQDAVMPYGMRLTANSHVIEQHLWRVRNMTAVHVYMNDDYFVNRDVAITDLFNEYGGTIVRTEKGILRKGVLGPPKGGSWGQGVRNTQLFNIMELDLRHEDYLPPALERQWSADRAQRGASGVDCPVLPTPLNDLIDIAYAHVPVSWPATLLPRRHRRYATHAPFVYCTNMHRFIQTRYAAELAYNALHHRTRRARDLFIPFLYNAFIMARPWQASPKFLPYLLELQRSRQEARTDAMPRTEIVLDNFDGCAPASLRGGFVASECIFGKFQDNTSLNDALMRRIAAEKPLYFNINAGFSSAEAIAQLRQFLHGKFPTPVYLEAGGASPGGEGLVGGAETAAGVESGGLSRVFGDLMALPVVGIVSYEEGVCPLVRSLALAFAGHHRGGVHVSVEEHGGATLREARAVLGHRVVSAMPAPACAYGPPVSTSAGAAGASVADVARRALDAAGETGGGGVELPSTCGGGGGGLRVRGFVVDARTPGAPVRSVAALRDALAVPAQTLSLEDFRVVAVGPSEGDVVLVVSREDADARAVHWVNGASESDLLVTYPLPVEAYEDMSAELRWSMP
ncbi:hypothetical protein JKF63_05310 [Porcisia hertigi]|uniref:Stealth protein CR3 conserved region 3 domain-containing protein n=1 Tax=Porcisia hertigi TaxID=2761500 RepID=A0A836IWF3_9TRYP|nr:hypothetical protein JKF63_05310 [Porcisia hertigi]